MKVLSEEAVNTSRQTELDMLRGFTAVLLIIVHAGLFLGNAISKGLWTFCDIIGSEPIAPVFMTLMGISMVYSRHQSPGDLSKRGLNLIILGYAQNFFRSLLPFIVFGNINEWASIEAFFVVDIFQFAGLAFLLIALLRKLKFSNYMILALSIVMVAIDQLIMLPDHIPWNSRLLTGFVNLFCPVSEWSCFPFLTWFVFPAFGLVFGELLKHCTNKKILYGILLAVGLCGTVCVYYQFHLLYPNYTSYYWGNNFYYMGLKNVLLTLLIICFVLSFWFFAGKALPRFVKGWFSFLSRNLSVYYILSWITISILIHAQSLFGWQFGDWETIGIMVVLIALCTWLTKLWLSVKKVVSK